MPDSDGLRALPAARIAQAIADAAARWCDADFPPRVRVQSAIVERLGYSLPVVEYALDRLFGGITAAALTAAIAGELGALGALDGPLAQPGRPPAWARGVDRVTIVSSDTTIGVAIVPLVYALCAKCAVTVKDRADALVAAFVATLGEEWPALAAAVDAHAWNGAAEPHAFAGADVVIAFGGPDALRAIRAACDADASFVPFGHRASAGYLDRAALAGDLAPLARAVARDALLYDGDGCLSLHLLFVERTPALDRFVDALADACAATAVEFPPGNRASARSARVTQYVAGAAFRAANGSGRVLRAPGGAWSIVVDPPAGDLPPFGGGTIPLLVVDDPAGAAAYVGAHALPLQALGVVAPGPATLALAAQLGAVRVAELGRMQDPPLAGHHGGRPRISDVVRWIDLA